MRVPSAMNQIIAFVGLPGSGKSTVARVLGESLRVPILSTGAALRDIAKSEPVLAVDLTHGKLGPEDLVRRLVDEFLAANRTAILDGYPRHAEQANYLLTRDAHLIIVHLVLPEGEALARIHQRPARGDDELASIATRMRRDGQAVTEVISILAPHVLECDARVAPFENAVRVSSLCESMSSASSINRPVRNGKTWT